MAISSWQWIPFSIIVLVLFFLDNCCFHRKAHAPSRKEIIFWICFWAACGLGFNAWLAITEDSDDSLTWFVAYIVEYGLSFDNLFVFYLVFKAYATPDHLQHRALFLGIIGALLFRIIFIFVGVGALQLGWGVKVVLGLFLVFSGAKTAFSGDDDDDEDLGDSRVMKCVRGVFPFTPIYEQNGAFFICKRPEDVIPTAADEEQGAVGALRKEGDPDVEMKEAASIGVGAAGASASASAPAFVRSGSKRNAAAAAAAASSGVDELHDAAAGPVPVAGATVVDLNASEAAAAGGEDGSLSDNNNLSSPSSPPAPGYVPPLHRKGTKKGDQKHDMERATKCCFCIRCCCTSTPLVAVVITMELIDILFAVDSVAAKVSMTDDIFTVYTSTIFALFGLRAMYFGLAKMVKSFFLLKYGVAVVLVFLGIKIGISNWAEMEPWVSLPIILGCLLISLLLSYFPPIKRRCHPDHKEKEEKEGATPADPTLEGGDADARAAAAAFGPAATGAGGDSVSTADHDHDHDADLDHGGAGGGASGEKKRLRGGADVDSSAGGAGAGAEGAGSLGGHRDFDDADLERLDRLGHSATKGNFPSRAGSGAAAGGGAGDSTGSTLSAAGSSTASRTSAASARRSTEDDADALAASLR